MGDEVGCDDEEIVPQKSAGAKALLAKLGA